MSTTPEQPNHHDGPSDRLDKLAEVSEDLQLIADSDLEYAKYAENFLEALREAGYDV